MYAQVNAEGHAQNMMEAILDYKKDSYTVDKEDIYITTKYGWCHIQKNFGMVVIG